MQKDNIEYDSERTAAMNNFGITVKRFSNKEVFDDTEKIIEDIQYIISKLKTENSNQ